jgi:hypothetical protein
LGAIDDHDYGCNNGDRTFPYRIESNRLYLQFLQASNGGPTSTSAEAAPATAGSSALPAVNLDVMVRRAQDGHGVYGVKVFDFGRRLANASAPVLLTDREAGLETTTDDEDTAENEFGGGAPDGRTAILSNRSVAVFLLDVRSNKDPWPSRHPDRYSPDYSADFLGERQWRWLESTLRRSNARVNLVVQGLQVHADRYYDGNVVESWGRFPTSQHRLYQAILKSGAANPVLLSGDVHMSELLLKDCRQPTQRRRHRPQSTRRYLLEVTASGMTHSWGGPSICARPHSSLPCRSAAVAKSLHAGMHWAHVNGAWTDLVDTRHPSVRSLLALSSAWFSNEAGRDKDTGEGGASSQTPPPSQGLQFVLQRTFGELEFDWDQDRLWIRFFGHGEPRGGGAGPAVLRSATAWKLDALGADHPVMEGGSGGGSSELSSDDFDRAWGDLRAHGAIRGDDDWICLNYRGNPSFLLKLYGVATPVLLAGALMCLPVVLPAFLGYFLLIRRRYSAHDAKDRGTP